MESLEKYLFKNVIVADIYGSVHMGYVDLFTSALDDEEMHEESIGIIPDKSAKSGVWLYRSEISSIEIAD